MINKATFRSVFITFNRMLKAYVDQGIPLTSTQVGDALQSVCFAMGWTPQQYESRLHEAMKSGECEQIWNNLDNDASLRAVN